MDAGGSTRGGPQARPDKASKPAAIGRRGGEPEDVERITGCSAATKEGCPQAAPLVCHREVNGLSVPRHRHFVVPLYEISRGHDDFLRAREATRASATTTRSLSDRSGFLPDSIRRTGAAGGLGGFFLPTMLGAANDATGTYGLGSLLLAGAFLIGALVLLQLGSLWTTRWQPHAVKQSGIFCYRGVVRDLVDEETA
jgi:hypothetical protein